jgi:hypothetical protein
MDIEAYVARVSLHVRAGRWDSARSVIAEAEEDAALSASPPERVTLDSQLADWLPLREVNSLESLGVLTVREAAQRTREELLSLPGFGPQALLRVLRLVTTAVENE